MNYKKLYELKIGQKELSFAENISELFSFGFEVELAFIPKIKKQKHYYDIRDFEYMYNLGQVFTDYRHGNFYYIENKFDEYVDNKTESLATEYANENTNDEDEWNDFFNEKVDEITNNYEISISDFAEEYGLENILKELNPIDDYEVYDNNEFVIIEEEDVSERELWDMSYKELSDYVGPIDIDSDDYDEEEYDRYVITSDSSINYDKEKNELPIEIISPVFDDFKTFMKNLNMVLKFIKENGYTNTSTGLHINISFKNSDIKVDVIKLNMLLEDEYLAKLFGREDNTFTKTTNKFIEQHLKEHGKIYNNEDIKKVVNVIINTDEKNRTINISKLFNKGYIEFRMIGGKNYEKELSTISYVIKRIIYVLYVSSDKNLALKEYKEKLGKFILNQHKKLSNTISKDDFYELKDQQEKNIINYETFKVFDNINSDILFPKNEEKYIKELFKTFNDLLDNTNNKLLKKIAIDSVKKIKNKFNISNKYLKKELSNINNSSFSDKEMNKIYIILKLNE